MGSKPEADLAAIERAMVAIRRSQSRRQLARLARERGADLGQHRPDAAAGRPVSTSTVEVLDALEAAEQGGAPATVSSIAGALGLDQPRASRLVAAAVAEGMVRREADQGDGRRALLVRTPAGVAASEQVHRFRRQVFAAAMTDWPAADRAHFARLLTRFVEALGA